MERSKKNCWNFVIYDNAFITFSLPRRNSLKFRRGNYFRVTSSKKWRLYFINILIFSFFFTTKQNNAIGKWNRSIHRSTVTHLYLQHKNFRYLLISLLYVFRVENEVCFRIRLQQWGEIAKNNQFTQVLFCRPNKSNSEIGRSQGVLAWSWWDVTLCLGWVVPNILNYRGAFICEIKNALWPFEMLESTHPMTQHLIPEQSSVHLSRVARIGGNTWITGFYPVDGICVCVFLHTYPAMKMEQSVPKRRHIKFRRRWITQN